MHIFLSRWVWLISNSTSIHSENRSHWWWCLFLRCTFVSKLLQHWKCNFPLKCCTNSDHSASFAISLNRKNQSDELLSSSGKRSRFCASLWVKKRKLISATWIELKWETHSSSKVFISDEISGCGKISSKMWNEVPSARYVVQISSSIWMGKIKVTYSHESLSSLCHSHEAHGQENRSFVSYRSSIVLRR